MRTQLGPLPAARGPRDFLLDWVWCFCKLTIVVLMLTWSAIDDLYVAEYGPPEHRIIIPLYPVVPSPPAEPESRGMASRPSRPVMEPTATF